MGKSLSTIHSFHLYFGALFLKGGEGGAIEEEFPFSFPYSRGPTDVEKMYCLIICIWNKQTKKKVPKIEYPYILWELETECKRPDAPVELAFFLHLYSTFSNYHLSIRTNEFTEILRYFQFQLEAAMGSPKCKFKEKKTIKNW